MVQSRKRTQPHRRKISKQQNQTSQRASSHDDVRFYFYPQPKTTRFQPQKTTHIQKKLLPHLGGDKEGAKKQKPRPTKPYAAPERAYATPSKEYAALSKEYAAPSKEYAAPSKA
jgi:hypothetical protein